MEAKRDLIRDVRRLYSIRAILNIPERKKVIVCPLPFHHHVNYTPSFSIYRGKDGEERWHCFGSCNKDGDVIDLIGYLRISGYDPKNPQHVYQAVAMLGGFEMELPVKPKKRTKFSIPKGELTDWVVQYAESRGLSRKTLEHFKVFQYKHYMAIPIVEFGEIIGCKLRNLTPDGLRYTSLKGSRSGIFNHDGVRSDCPLFVVKGEIAAMFLYEHGYNVCAPTGGEGMLLKDYLYLFTGKTVVVGDNDPGPKGEKTRQLAYRRGEEIGAIVIFPPNGYKDIDEYLIRTGDFSILEV